MRAYLDTSSLLKLYHREDGTDEVMKILSGGIDEIVLSELAVLEMRSALWKKVRQCEITADVAMSAVKCFEDDCGKFGWVYLNSEIVQSAAMLLIKYGEKGLRTLDSVQLACAKMSRDMDCIFLTSDSLLKTLFVEEGLRVA